MTDDELHMMHAVFFPQPISQGRAVWQPPIDIYRTTDGWLLKVDLAGVLPEDVVVEAGDGRIEISGMRRDWCLEEGCCHYRMEISYSQFDRVVELPDDFRHSRITTEFRHGMLLIRVETGAI